MGAVCLSRLLILRPRLAKRSPEALTLSRPDKESYRDAMSRLAGHVHIAAVDHAGERRGVTITAACSVSDDPATLLICLNTKNPKNRLFLEAGVFSLNLLGADQLALAQVFSGSEPIEGDRFDHGRWTKLATGAPVLEDAVAAFDCRIVESRVVATHMVLFGAVEAVVLGQRNPALVYLDRAYRSL
ncbi:4-hydroxyphenylacetate 3-monooxygenase [Rhizobium rhizosphaerae]|uniref:4-hydroxyphenylacetate 3-monooxygenase n=1 Tax=Xaviernesmea rhizosphaerae TaxID=1672749 RepID=A0A1Q9AFY8_9HYPH|nr:4-hydroxyphenylacetate 3-monooxygenase [Xaviernesmea rhizosphaerae]